MLLENVSAMRFCCTTNLLIRASFCSGENVEDAFLETARKIYQNIQDGRYDPMMLRSAQPCNVTRNYSLDLNAADTGVQPKQTLPRPTAAGAAQGEGQKCNC